MWVIYVQFQDAVHICSTLYHGVCIPRVEHEKKMVQCKPYGAVLKNQNSIKTMCDIKTCIKPSEHRFTVLEEIYSELEYFQNILE